MNVRKPVDYGVMFTVLNTLMAANLPQMELYCEIGRLVSGRPEKGAAVAAAEYLCGAYPDASGFSPRNLRRMREFYRTYESGLMVMAEAMAIGWTQNVVILEADLTLQERKWYIHAVRQFGWSKLELQRMIETNAHVELSLDSTDPVCYIDENTVAKETSSYDIAKDSQCHRTGSLGSVDGFPVLFRFFRPQSLLRGIYPQSRLVHREHRWPMGVADGTGPPGVVFRPYQWHNGYDFDSHHEKELTDHRENCAMDVLRWEGPTLSRDLKRMAGFGGDDLQDFGTVITSLQMQTYITVHSFKYADDKCRKPPGLSTMQ